MTYTSELFLGVVPKELRGFSVEEIAQMIRLVQQGLTATEPRMNEEEIAEAAKAIAAEAAISAEAE